MHAAMRLPRRWGATLSSSRDRRAVHASCRAPMRPGPPPHGRHAVAALPAAPLPPPPPHAHTTISAAAARSPQAPHSAVPAAFALCRIHGDGSCMFRALAQGEHHAKHDGPLAAEREYDAALQLRRDVVAELRRCREDIEPFLPGIADDFDAYLLKMSQPGVWGGEPELVMAANLLRRPISVYQPRGRAGGDTIAPRHIITYGEDHHAAAPIHLLWSGHHYDLLLPHKPPSSKL